MSLLSQLSSSPHVTTTPSALPPANEIEGSNRSSILLDEVRNLRVPCHSNFSHFLATLVNLTLHHYHESVNMSGVHQFQYHGKQGSPVPDDEKNAVLYIIVVLSFYSLGIVIMMVKYMKKHDRQMEDFNYQDYIQAQRNRMTQARWRPLNRLALSALNTANVIPQTVSKERRVTYV